MAFHSSPTLTQWLPVAQPAQSECSRAHSASWLPVGPTVRTSCSNPLLLAHDMRWRPKMKTERVLMMTAGASSQSGLSTTKKNIRASLAREVEQERQQSVRRPPGFPRATLAPPANGSCLAAFERCCRVDGAPVTRRLARSSKISSSESAARRVGVGRVGRRIASQQVCRG